MADNKDSISLGISNSDTLRVKKRFERSNEVIGRKQDKLDTEDLEISRKTDRYGRDVAQLVNILQQELQKSGNSDINADGSTHDFMLSLLRADEKEEKGKRVRQGKKASEDMEAIKKQIVEANKQHLQSLLAINKEQHYSNLIVYNMIMKIIPKMRMVIKTLSNTLISPDDFTKSSLNVDIDADIVGSENSVAEVKRRVEDIIENFKIDRNLQEDIISYLRDGKMFYLCLSMNKELVRLLSENSEEDISKHVNLKYKHLEEKLVNSTLLKGIPLTEEGVAITLKETLNKFDNESKILIEEFAEAFNIPSTESFEKVTESFNAFDKELNETFVLGSGENLLSEIFNESDNDVKSILNEDSAFNTFFGSSSGLVGNSGQFQNSMTKVMSDRLDIGYNKNKIKIAGRDRAIVKRVSSGNIVPLEFEGDVLGYVYLDLVEVDMDGKVIPSDKSTQGMESTGLVPSQTLAGGNALQNMVYAGKDDGIDGNGDYGRMNGIDSPNGDPLDPVTDLRLRFMSDAFVNRLSNETNLRLIRRSAGLKQAVYNTLCIRKLRRNQKVRIVYLKPNEVVMFDRGQSIFDNILFFAKLYITALMTILMQNVLRGAPKRIVYVEVGLDNNGANTTQQVIRDMKSREISSVHAMDMQTLLNYSGEFQDLYIPVIDGEKPISFDTLEAQEAKSLDDEFLKWLGDNIYAGMGTPAAFVQESENIEFAKTLSMQNGRWLRDVIADQAILGKCYTDLIRLIYFIEYRTTDIIELGKKHNDSANIGDQIKNNETDLLRTFDVSAINIKFPSPASLNLTNSVDQVNNAQSFVNAIAEFIDLSNFSSTLEVDDSKKEVLEKDYKLRIVKKLCPNVDWDEIESYINDTIKDYTKSKNEKEANKKEDAEDQQSHDTQF